jgi:hypothetical protein
MSSKMESVRLQNGTLIRHKTAGYTGMIDGTTEIRECFTAGGKLLAGNSGKQTFQYRVVIAGDSMRRIAPEEDLEVLQAAGIIVCHNCKTSFRSKPGAAGKASGLCQCGHWICPTCLSCQDIVGDAERGVSVCAGQRRRLVRKVALEKKKKTPARINKVMNIS